MRRVERVFIVFAVVVVCSVSLFAMRAFAQMPGCCMQGNMTSLPQEASSPANPITNAKIQLGRMLFFDARLSRNRDVSCNSCHDLASYGVDHQPVSTGDKGQHGSRNAPTVYNAALYVAQFWDGRAADVEEQAKGPILNPVEMAMSSPQEIEAMLKSIPGYVTAFRDAFPGEQNPVTFDNAAKAIGAFERVLITPSRWDRYLAGDATAITAAELAGFTTFDRAGCTICHNGSTVGGTSFQKLGQVEPWPNSKDTGRQMVTGNVADHMVFKVPSLRNVEMTGPYFHDGSVATLKKAIAYMGHYQLGRDLSDAEIGSIAVWLHTLTGDIPKQMITPPQLPPDAN